MEVICKAITADVKRQVNTIMDTVPKDAYSPERWNEWRNLLTLKLLKFRLSL